MGDLINLRQSRKRRDREREAVVAAENRIVSGMTKAERRRIEAEREAGERRLDAHRLQSDEPG